MRHHDDHIVEIGRVVDDCTKKLVKCIDVAAYEDDRDLYSMLQTDVLDESKYDKLMIMSR